MVLTAGRGSRLRPLTDVTPKPLIEIGGEPLLAHVLRTLRAAGVERVVCNLHHLGAQIRAWAGDGADFGLDIRYSEEPELLETGGAIRRALPLLCPDGETPFLVVNGDVWSTIAPATLPPPTATEQALLVLVPHPDYAASGDYDLDPHSGIVRAGERPALTFAGVSRLHPRLFLAAPPPGTAFRLPTLWQPLLGTPAVLGTRHDGPWFDIGTPTRLAAARAALGPTGSATQDAKRRLD